MNQIQNIQTVRERNNYKEFEKQLAAEKADQERKRLEPILKLTEENSRLLAEVREVEKQNLLLLPYDGPSDLLRFIDKVTPEHSKFTYDDWREVSMFAAFEAADYFDAKGIARPTEAELKLIFQFCFAQRPALYIGDSKAITSVFFLLKSEGVIRPDPVPEPQPEVVEPEKPVLRGREKEAADFRAYREELRNELFERIKATPFWGEAMQSLADSSHKEMGADAQIKLAEIFATGKFGEPSILNIRRAARAYWGDNVVGLLPEEVAEKELESLSSDEMLKKHPELGNPRSNVKGIQLSRSDVRDREDL